MSAISFIYARFFELINAKTAFGIFFYLKLLVFLGIGVYIGLIVYILSFGTTTVDYDENVVIVLGAGVQNNKAGKALQHRLDACIEYYGENPEVTIVVTGGLTRKKDTTEALVMKEYLIEKGIPTNKILLEDTSQSTKENYLLSKKILEQNNVKYDKIVFVTNSFHVYRAKSYAKFCGFENAASLSASTDIASFIPAVLREVLGVIDMWLFKLK